MADSQLSANELLQSSEWFEEFVVDQWDKKLRLIFWLVVWMRLASALMMNFSLAAQVALNHFATPEFWFHYRQLPDVVVLWPTRILNCFELIHTTFLGLEKDWYFLVSQSRNTLSVVSKRTNGRSRVVLDWPA